RWAGFRLMDRFLLFLLGTPLNGYSYGSQYAITSVDYLDMRGHELRPPFQNHYTKKLVGKRFRNGLDISQINYKFLLTLHARKDFSPLLRSKVARGEIGAIKNVCLHG